MKNKNPKTTLGKIRVEKNMTQQQLADKSGVSIRTIQGYELKEEKFKKASLEIIMKLAEALGIDEREFIYYNK